MTSTTPSTRQMVNMAEIHVLTGVGQLVGLGLGSCIGLAAYDGSKKIAGLAHIVLPEAFVDRAVTEPGKFADTALPELIRKMELAGASRASLKFAYCGGANVFKFGPGKTNDVLEVGRRNAEAVKAVLSKYSCRVIAQDVGGSSGRTMTFDAATGLIQVKVLSVGQEDLCTLS